MNLDAAFQTVYGRLPHPDETLRFNRLAKELGIRDNDAVWGIVFLLEAVMALNLRRFFACVACLSSME